MNSFPAFGESWKYHARGNHSDVINVLLILDGVNTRRVLLLSRKCFAVIFKSRYRAKVTQLHTVIFATVR